jgi:lipopolysaccharide transport system permease protein
LQLVQQTWLKYVLAINPVNAAIELFRHPFSGTPLDINIIIIGFASTLFISIIGLYYFRKTEAFFADLA